MIVPLRSSAPLRAVAGAALAIATSVLVGWSTGGDGVLTTWGTMPSATPWTALMAALLAIAVLVPPRARTWACGIAAVIAMVSLATPALAVSLQGRLWPEALQAPAPGIDVAVLLLVVAVWASTSTSGADGLVTTLAAGAGAVVALSLAGRAVGAGWLTDAGASPTEAGMSLPSTTMLLLLTVASWLLESSSVDALVRGRRRQHVVGIATALLAPVLVVWLLPSPTGPTRLDYATTALLVVVITLTTQLAIVASSHRDALLAVETMLDGSPEPTLFVDPAGVIVRANRATTDHFGWPLDELVGVPLTRLAPMAVTAADDGHLGPIGRPSAPALPPPRRLTATRRDGTDFPAEITLAPVRMRGRTLVAATIRDVTAHEQQVATLRGLQDMQSMFLTAVSHELRTPLTVVMGLAETLRGRADELSTPARRAVLERLLANAGRLDVLLSDLLDVDRLQRGVAGAVAAVDVGEVVRTQARQSALELGIDVQVDVEDGVPRAATDPVLLPRVVDNLLANAGKYAAGPVEVHVRRADDGAVIVVDDHGPGVPEPLRDQVFEPFRRGTRVNPATPGVGIGLSLVAGVAAAAGGRAWVQRRDDGAPGASFRVLLPAATPPDAAVVTLDEDDPVRPAPSAS